MVAPSNLANVKPEKVSLKVERWSRSRLTGLHEGKLVGALPGLRAAPYIHVEPLGPVRGVIEQQDRGSCARFDAPGMPAFVLWGVVVLCLQLNRARTNYPKRFGQQ